MGLQPFEQTDASLAGLAFCRYTAKDPPLPPRQWWVSCDSEDCDGEFPRTNNSENARPYLSTVAGISEAVSENRLLNAV